MNDERKQMLKLLGERFVFFRKKKGYSRKKAATILGITSRTLASYERGEREISLDSTKNLATLYGTTFEQLTDYKCIHTKTDDSITEEEYGLDRLLL